MINYIRKNNFVENNNYDYIIIAGTAKSATSIILHVPIQEKAIRWGVDVMDERGYDSETGKLIVAVDKRYFRSTEVETLLGDPSKNKEKLGWEPKITLEEMV